MNWSEFPKSTFHHQEPIKPKPKKSNVELAAERLARTGSRRDLRKLNKAKGNAR